jgi:AraC-like DNA-binding protein
VRGEQDAAAKLTAEQVIQIRIKYANGNLTYKQLAQEFGMSKSAICDVVTKHTWQHVPPPS